MLSHIFKIQIIIIYKLWNVISNTRQQIHRQIQKQKTWGTHEQSVDVSICNTQLATNPSSNPKQETWDLYEQDNRTWWSIVCCHLTKATTPSQNWKQQAIPCISLLGYTRDDLELWNTISRKAYTHRTRKSLKKWGRTRRSCDKHKPVIN